jgi:hypothetical protein
MSNSPFTPSIEVPAWVPKPLTPASHDPSTLIFTRGPAAPDVRVTTAAIPASLQPFQADAASVAGTRPGATLAPNFIYTTGGVQCFTQTLGEQETPAVCSGKASIAACTDSSNACLDAIARGLLGGLQPILEPSEHLQMK